MTPIDYMQNKIKKMAMAQKTFKGMAKSLKILFRSGFTFPLFHEDYLFFGGST